MAAFRDISPPIESGAREPDRIWPKQENEKGDCWPGEAESGIAAGRGAAPWSPCRPADAVHGCSEDWPSG